MRTSTVPSLPCRDLLHAAQTAARHNLHLAAGVFARISLETHLRDLADYHGAWPKKRSKAGIPEFAGALYNRRHIDKATHTEIKRLAHIGNMAAHNKGVGWFEIEQLVAGVREFIDRHVVDRQAVEFWQRFMGSEGSEGGEL